MTWLSSAAIVKTLDYRGFHEGFLRVFAAQLQANQACCRILLAPESFGLGRPRTLPTARVVLPLLQYLLFLF